MWPGPHEPKRRMANQGKYRSVDQKKREQVSEPQTRGMLQRVGINLGHSPDKGETNQQRLEGHLYRERELECQLRCQPQRKCPKKSYDQETGKHYYVVVDAHSTVETQCQDGGD